MPVTVATPERNVGTSASAAISSTTTATAASGARADPRRRVAVERPRAQAKARLGCGTDAGHAPVILSLARLASRAARMHRRALAAAPRRPLDTQQPLVRAAHPAGLDGCMRDRG